MTPLSSTAKTVGQPDDGEVRSRGAARTTDVPLQRRRVFPTFGKVDTHKL